MSVNDVQASLAALKQKFLERSRQEVSLLSDRAEKLREGTLDGEELSEAYRLLHRLAGSAGTFGMPELGEEARELEKSLKPEVEGPATRNTDTPLTETSFPDFRQGVHRLAELVSQSSDATTPEDTPVNSGALAVAEGIQVQILIDHPSPEVARDLTEALAHYGFQCRQLSPSDADLGRLISGSAGESIIVLTDAEHLEKFAAERSRLGISRIQLPLVCLSKEDSFDNRYWAATAGAEGFFPEPLDFTRLADAVESLVSEQKHPFSGRVVIVEDDPELAEHYRLVLTSVGLEVHLVDDPRQLMADLSAFQPDIVLMDVQLEALSGVHLAGMIRFEHRWLSLPIIFLSAEDDPENHLVAMSQGGDEFLMKPVADSYLARAVLLRCRRARLLYDLMNLDSLTGLLKHALIKERVNREVANCQRLVYPSSIAMIDIDHFKTVNDSWGHGVGDRVIKALANLLKNRLRETDVIGRYGGEEFLIILPGCNVDQGRTLLERIGRSFAEIVFWGSEDESFSVTLSAGVALLNSFTHGEAALEATDQALYRQKRGGRNGVSIHS